MAEKSQESASKISASSAMRRFGPVDIIIWMYNDVYIYDYN